MSQTVDANILIYAINEDAPEFEVASKLLNRLGRGPDLVYLFWPTVFAFLRLATHPAILPNPLSASEAERAIERLTERSHVKSPGEGTGFWNVYLQTAGAPRGNQVPDAHLAALMRAHGVRTIYTRDRDFRRFNGIEALDPFVG